VAEMKSKLPANFLIYLKSGHLTISDSEKTAIEFESSGETRILNILDLPTKLPGKMNLLKQLTEAKGLAKVLSKEGVTLEIKHKGKLILKLGKNAKPKFSSLVTFSRSVEIIDLKELRKLDKEIS
tara:strand:- start:2128 stop:2502 length:375 start_codon:yes stop_codon:yes gene_type:complete